MVNLKPFKSIQQSDAADYTASLAQTHKDEISNPRALLFSHESESLLFSQALLLSVKRYNLTVSVICNEKYHFQKVHMKIWAQYYTQSGKRKVPE